MNRSSRLAGIMGLLLTHSALMSLGRGEQADSELELLITQASALVESIPRGNVPEPQLKAIEAIRDMATATAEQEAKLVDALLRLRRSPEPNIANGAVHALAHRKHGELLPELLPDLETATNATDAQRIVSFVQSFDSDELPARPVTLLRSAVEARHAAGRSAAVEIVEKLGARELRPELERLVFGDPVEAVREQAARTLAALGCRESAPALRKAVRGCEATRQAIGYALTRIGSDADLPVLLPLLGSPSAETRKRFAEGVGKMSLVNKTAAADALALLLKDPSEDVRLAAAVSLGELQDDRAVSTLRDFLRGKSRAFGNGHDILRTLRTMGSEAAIAVLNDYFLVNGEVQAYLTRLQHPSTSASLWDLYLADPVRLDPARPLEPRGNQEALTALEQIGNEELLRAVRLRSTATSDDVERTLLGRLATVLGTRFPDVAQEPIAELRTTLPMQASDRDRDGVPDRLDKYPDDDRRSEDIPIKKFASPVEIPVKFYGVISLADDGPSSKNVLFMAMDDEHRVGWVSRTNDTDPPDYHVTSSYITDKDEWALPNPGDTPGVYRLTPHSVNAQGTAVGTAHRKKVAVAQRQDIHAAHLTYQSGFIFEKGKLRFDPPPPFAGDALNVTYQRINNAGLIFGQREIRTRDGDRDIFTMRSFLGDRIFSDVPAFETTAMTEGGHLLCTRLQGGKLESFAWDGTRFQELGSLAGKPQDVRAFAINQQLQIVGRSDALDREHCPIGFLWENGKMRHFPELIPEEFRAHLRSAIPYLITDDGSINFTAEVRRGLLPQFWPKKAYLLEKSDEGGFFLSEQRMMSPSVEE